MKSIKFFIPLLLLTLTTMSAQSGNRSGDRLLDQLDLSPDQRSQIEEIRAEVKAEIWRLREDKTISEDARRERREMIREKSRNEISSILTPEQQDQYRALRDEKRGQRKTNRSHGQRKLSSEQREAMKASDARISEALSRSERKFLESLQPRFEIPTDPDQTLQDAPKGSKAEAKRRQVRMTLEEMRENNSDDYNDLLQMSDKHAELLDAEFEQRKQVRGTSRAKAKRPSAHQREAQTTMTPAERDTHRRILQLIGSQIRDAEKQ